ncbi:MAG: ABC transporter permease [Bacteroidales bacterium]
MIRNLLGHGIRVFRRHRTYFYLNINGLSIGIATSLTIAIYVLNELSYDNYNEKKDRIYRVLLDGKIGEQEVKTSSTASPVGPYMYNEFPEIENFMRMNPWGETVLKIDNQAFTEEYFVEVDSSFFNIFSIPLIHGDKNNVLNQPRTLVLSRSTAMKIFGSLDVVGRSVKVSTDSSLYRVTGVMEDIPSNSHFSANVLSSFMTNQRSDDNQWLSNSFSTYVLLKPGADPEAVNDKIPDMITRNVGSFLEQYLGISLEEFLEGGNRYSMYLQELKDIHLNPEVDHQEKPATDPKYLLIFGSIAILIIIIAAINFMNLSTAQAAKRSMEVGLKKVSGASKGTLILQFLLESVILSFIALVVAVLIVYLTLPYVNQISDASMDLSVIRKWYFIPILIIFAFFVGIFAGSYPAFYLSSFSPVKVIKSGIQSSKSNTRLRSVLVVVQFAISIVLIIGTLIIYRQINYMTNKDLGFDQERILVISRASALGSRVETFKNELLSIPGVLNTASSTAVPGRNNNTNGYSIEGESDESVLLETNWVDWDYFDTYGFTIVEGRSFDRDFETDRDAVVINETAVRQFGLENAIGTRFINRDNDEMNYLSVIGVAADFHFRSLNTKIMPYVFRFKTEDFHWGYLSIKLAPNFTRETIEQIDNTWRGFTSNDPLQYFFLDEDFQQKYQAEKRNASLSILFSILAIFIASLGLFGLTSYTVQARTKEIGIRKAMGASVARVFYIITKDIAILVVIATFIAWPVIYYAGNNWLSNYYYRIDLGLGSFLLGFIFALLIAVLTISYQAIKSARTNPVNSLRYE